MQDTVAEGTGRVSSPPRQIQSIDDVFNAVGNTTATVMAIDVTYIRQKDVTATEDAAQDLNESNDWLEENIFSLSVDELEQLSQMVTTLEIIVEDKMAKVESKLDWMGDPIDSPFMVTFIVLSCLAVILLVAAAYAICGNTSFLWKKRKNAEHQA